ncbi:galactosylceramide sulfotransferase-like [Ylistrum balloti]|uniref:galactosylceramide sulfotransferase-like n=1 Tax=Ylistrum balloti TaxID=509963 RepID=UPI002905CD73|nr:galactosylceramide sulfotransferase-like [Ylistrum balloti]
MIILRLLFYRYILVLGPIFIILSIFALWHSDWLTTSQATHRRDHSAPSRIEHQLRLRQVKVVKDVNRSKEFNRCSEQTDVIFIKVHKAGSSTVSNILQRFGSFRKLNFVLPNKTLHELRYNYIGDPGDSVTTENILPVPPGEHYNIMCNHVIYNSATFTRLFPTKRFFYLAIVREPLDHFLSVIRYYGYSEFSYIQTILSIEADNPISEYLKSPEDYEPVIPYISYTNNRQSVDLGLPVEAIGNASAIQDYVDIVRRDFDFIMLLEYFDESLIYLKRKLCWSYKDILYHPKNSRWNNQKYTLSVQDLARLKRWNSADYALYDELHSDFWKKIGNAGEYFFEEVLHFKRITEMVRVYCSNVDVTDDLEVTGSRWEANFTISSVDCLMLGLDELQFLDKIYFENYGIVQSKAV